MGTQADLWAPSVPPSPPEGVPSDPARRRLTRYEDEVFRAARRAGHINVRGPRGTSWHAQNETRERGRLLGLFGAMAAGLVVPDWLRELARLDGAIAREACELEVIRETNAAEDWPRRPAMIRAEERDCPTCRRSPGERHEESCPDALPWELVAPDPGVAVLAHSVTEGCATDNWIARLPEGAIAVLVRQQEVPIDRDCPDCERRHVAARKPRPPAKSCPRCGARRSVWYRAVLRPADGVPYELLADLARPRPTEAEPDRLAVLGVWGDWLGERGIRAPGPNAWRVRGTR